MAVGVVKSSKNEHFLGKYIWGKKLAFFNVFFELEISFPGLIFARLGLTDDLIPTPYQPYTTLQPPNTEPIPTLYVIIPPDGSPIGSYTGLIRNLFGFISTPYYLYPHSTDPMRTLYGPYATFYGP